MAAAAAAARAEHEDDSDSDDAMEESDDEDDDSTFDVGKDTVPVEQPKKQLYTVLQQQATGDSGRNFVGSSHVYAGIGGGRPVRVRQPVRGRRRLFLRWSKRRTKRKTMRRSNFNLDTCF